MPTETDLSGFEGEVTTPTLHGGEAYAWTLVAASAVKNTGRFGRGRHATKRLGMLETTGHIDFFMRKGAAGTAPGIYDTAVDGSALTLQVAEDCTYGMTAVFSRASLGVAFADPAIPYGWDYEANGTVTETWDEGP